MFINKLKMSIAESRMLEDTLAKVASFDAKMDALIEYRGLTVKELDEGTFEVVKKTAEDMPSGDYINPIPYLDGMTVEQGKFYTDGEDIWEAYNSGVPSGFADKAFFDIIGA